MAMKTRMVTVTGIVTMPFRLTPMRTMMLMVTVLVMKQIWTMTVTVFLMLKTMPS